MVLMVKKLLAKAGDIGGTGSIPGWVRASGGWHGSPLQYSCQKNFINRGAWQTTVYRVTEELNITEAT